MSLSNNFLTNIMQTRKEEIMYLKTSSGFIIYVSESGIDYNHDDETIIISRKNVDGKTYIHEILDSTEISGIGLKNNNPNFS